MIRIDRILICKSLVKCGDLLYKVAMVIWKHHNVVKVCGGEYPYHHFEQVSNIAQKKRLKTYIALRRS